MRFILSLSVLMAFVLVSWSQDDNTAVLRGVTMDEDGQPLPFVHVVAFPSKQGAVSDLDGKFGLIFPKTDTIRFSIIGYKQSYLLFNDSTENAFELEVLLSKEAVILDTVEIFPLDSSILLLNRDYLPSFSVPGVRKPTGPARDRTITTIPNTANEVRGGLALSGPFTRASKEFKERQRFTELQIARLQEKEFEREVQARLEGPLEQLRDALSLSDFEFEEFVKFYEPNKGFVIRAEYFDIYSSLVEAYQQFRLLADQNYEYDR